ncbi:PTS sugar transporter subunit IIA [Clostridium sp.]|uniref:PTS sugar transporter subunit IIA n=1 Tax=Clostridium sp. TaxID=1506 RepID=UPI00291561B2|nr:PTS sugar transporter subunit IIA [Clostridium sp.]MDU7241262.1 PTS sugar transporter subunit IIA [Clostridium sp.]
MNFDFYFGKELIFNKLRFKSNEEALIFLSRKLYEKGYVKEEFKDAVISRERQYPTGLASKSVKIAIPHAEHTMVNKSAIAVAILEEPIEFRSMENSEDILDVKIIIMLAIDKPHGHIEMLQKIAVLIRDENALLKSLEADTPEEIESIFGKFLR